MSLRPRHILSSDTGESLGVRKWIAIVSRCHRCPEKSFGWARQERNPVGHTAARSIPSTCTRPRPISHANSILGYTIKLTLVLERELLQMAQG